MTLRRAERPTAASHLADAPFSLYRGSKIQPPERQWSSPPPDSNPMAEGARYRSDLGQRWHFTKETLPFYKINPPS